MATYKAEVVTRDGVVDEFGVEHTYHTTEVLSEMLFVLTAKLSKEERDGLTEYHRDVPSLLPIKMNSFPRFYSFPEKYTHCMVTEADLEAMMDIFKHDKEHKIDWPTGERLAHCPQCGRNDVYMGRFCIETMIKGYFVPPSFGVVVGIKSPNMLPVMVSSYFVPRVFHEACYDKLAKEAEHFGLKLPSKPNTEGQKTKAGFKYPIVTELWIRAQRIVRVLEQRLKREFAPGSVFNRKYSDKMQTILLPSCRTKKDLMSEEFNTAYIDFMKWMGDRKKGDVSDADYFLTLGNRDFKAGNFEGAFGSYTKSIAAYPERYIVWYKRSLALAGLGRYEESMRDADQCVILNPKYKKAYIGKAKALLELSKTSEAINCLVTAGNLDPTNTQVAQLLVKATGVDGDDDVVAIVKIIEDERFERLESFLQLVCGHCCVVCGIAEREADGEMTAVQDVEDCPLDKHVSARLAHRFISSDSSRLHWFGMRFKAVAGPVFEEIAKEQPSKNTVTSSAEKNNSTTAVDIYRDTRRLHLAEYLEKTMSDEGRLALLEQREADVIYQIKSNLEAAEENNQSSKPKSDWIQKKKTLTKEKLQLQRELEIIQKCIAQVRESIKEDQQTQSKSEGKKKKKNKKEDTRMVKANDLPRQLIAKADIESLRNDRELHDHHKFPYDLDLRAGRHVDIGLLFSNEFLMELEGNNLKWQRHYWFNQPRRRRHSDEEPPDSDEDDDDDDTEKDREVPFYITPSFRTISIPSVAADVQETVEEPATGTQGTDKVCANCSTSSGKLLKCGQCLKVYYCGRECQKLDRKKHKKDCTKQ